MTTDGGQEEKNHCSHEASDDAYSSLNKDELIRPVFLIKREKWKAKVGKNKGLKSEANDLESCTAENFALRWKIVPTVVSHQNSTCEERDNSWHVDNFTNRVREIAHREDQESLLDGRDS